MYSVKNVKTFTGREGAGFNADLYRGDKRVALIIDDASGGPTQFQWTDMMNGRTSVKVHDCNGGTWDRACTREEREFILHAQSVYKGDEFMCDECYVTDLVDAYENEKRLKRMCRTKAMAEQWGRLVA